MRSTASDQQWASTLCQMRGISTEEDLPSYNRALVALTRNSQWTLAQQAFVTVACGFQLNAISYSIAMQASGHLLHRWPHAVNVFDSQQWAGMECNVIHAGLLASAMSSSWQKVWVLLSLLRVQALRISTILAGTALASLASHGSWWQACSFFQGCSNQDLEANLIFTNTLIGATGTHWLRALDMRSHLAQQKRSLITHSASISCCDAAGMWAQACLLLEEASRSRCSLDVVVMTAWQQAVQQLLRLQASNSMLNRIPTSTAISACEKAACWVVAHSLLQRCRFSTTEFDIVLCSSCISACEKGKQWQRALWLLDVIQDMLLEANPITFGAAISACEVCDQWERSLHLLEDMQARCLRANVITFNAIVKSCERAMKWNEAVQLLRLAQGGMLQPNIITYNAALAACSCASKWDQVLTLYLELCANELNPDSVAYAAVISAFEFMDLQQVPPVLSKLDALGVLRSRLATRVDTAALENRPC
ncbi:unnamed protein product [Symbiodinium necroappetens]|uniref:Pentatricopeptide repeat-containing protein, chloroplastic n=1 Tax=Symbiodinium necroappetens TaxID=1628268 RepID=A0A812W0G4_9DINO|nr:unnamed protein product [Symbiodinium necroappetens]